MNCYEVEKRALAEVILDHLVKIFPGNVHAVAELNLAIRDRELMVIVGPSGCGKTTTLRMIAGLESIGAGTVRIGDRIVNDVPPRDRDIVMVFQNAALYPHLSVYGNLAFGLKLRKTPRAEIERRVQWAARLLDLSDLLRRKPAALSGGQRQRVALGRAIVRRPQVFLFDEPLASLDTPWRIESRAELKRLHQRLETTTVYVTHDQEEAMTLGDRVAVMDHGLIQQCDTPLRLYQRPINRFVAGFLGTPPMNFLEGTLGRDDDKLRFHSQDVNIALTAEQAHCLGDHVGRQVVLGIRPEGLDPLGARGTGGHPSQSIRVTVDFVHPLGAVMDLLATTRSGERLVSRTRWEKIQPGSQIDFYLDMKLVHLFEPMQGQGVAAAGCSSGRNLTLGAAQGEGGESYDSRSTG